MTQKFRLLAASLLLASAVAACGSSSSTPNPTAKAAPTAPAVTAGPTARIPETASKPVSGHASVAIRSYMFAPMHLTVTAGTKVSFHNYDQTSHTATAINQSFDTGTIKPGRTATVTLKKPGTYAYHCLFHAFMTATITVVAAKA